MKSTFLLILGALSLAAPVSVAQAGPDPQASSSRQDGPDDGVSFAGRHANFLVKLTSSTSTESSEPGDPVTGVVIDPVPVRGGRLVGTIERADRCFLTFSFHAVHFEGKTYTIESQVTAVVNSKGVAGQDDLGQRIRMVGGGIIAYGTSSAVNEGAEIRFVAWQE